MILQGRLFRRVCVWRPRKGVRTPVWRTGCNIEAPKLTRASPGTNEKRDEGEGKSNGDEAGVVVVVVVVVVVMGTIEWVVVVKSPPPSFFRVQLMHVTAAAKNSSVQAALLTGRPIRGQMGSRLSQRCYSQQKGCFRQSSVLWNIRCSTNEQYHTIPLQ